ncbi:MAG TPA: hypothetical protein VKV69_11980 [Actinomycetota bacterium]|nr:hypothetical protein [Actinomycetota bacterium]
MFNRMKDETAGPRCSSCSAPVGAAKVCPCGKATPNMSFAERTAYEVEQYKAYKARASA